MVNGQLSVRHRTQWTSFAPLTFHREKIQLEAVALSTHRLPVAHLLQMIACFVRGVLTTFVRMKNEPIHAALLGESVSELSHLERVVY